MKKEIKLQSKDVRSIFLIITIPLLLTFIIEHFGELNHKGYYLDDNYKRFKAFTSYFKTPFGSEIIEDVSHKNLSLDDSYKIQESYFGKLPYVIKGLFKDILYPLSLSVILFIIYLFRRKYSIKIS